MIRYLLKRILLGILLIAGLLVITFFLVRLSPGNPAALAWDPTRSAHAMERLQTVWGLDQPLLAQFGAWSMSLLQGDFGISYASHRPVNAVLAETIPNTLYLTLPVLAVQLLFGTLLGIWQVLKINTFFDRLASFVSLLFYAIPSFWLAVLLVMVFAQGLHWLPSSQMLSIGHDDMDFGAKAIDRIRHLILPVFTLGLASLGMTSRYVRNGLAGILRQPFITAARARGFHEQHVITHHALKNIMVPVVTVTGQHLPALISGSVVIELIFSWPGMGRLMVMASYARDYPVIIACTFVMSLFVVLGTLLTDVICAWIDPRIRLGGTTL